MTASGPLVVAVSLKLYFDTARTLSYAHQVAAGVAAMGETIEGRVTVAVLPDFLSIPQVSAELAAAGVVLGAQDLCQADRGAFTGEVSGLDLAAAGCRVVEVGHAERRSIYAESDELVAAKVAAASRSGLTPLLCVGETIRSTPAKAAVECLSQIRTATAGTDLEEVWVAYEPVWAIGAPAPAPSDHVRAVSDGLRAGIGARWPRLRVLYGGSAGPGLLSVLHPSVDGLFLGRFAHDPQALLSVVAEAAALVQV